MCVYDGYDIRFGTTDVSHVKKICETHWRRAWLSECEHVSSDSFHIYYGLRCAANVMPFIGRLGTKSLYTCMRVWLCVCVCIKRYREISLHSRFDLSVDSFCRSQIGTIFFLLFSFRFNQITHFHINKVRMAQWVFVDYFDIEVKSEQNANVAVVFCGGKRNQTIFCGYVLDDKHTSLWWNFSRHLNWLFVWHTQQQHPNSSHRLRWISTRCCNKHKSLQMKHMDRRRCREWNGRCRKSCWPPVNCIRV